MQNDSAPPNEQTASLILNAMTNEKVLLVKRMETGEQNFVFAVNTMKADYVLRMTDASHRYKFESAIQWQKLLLPLGVPLAPFIAFDLEGQYSAYPSLLMMRLPGDDLINVYSSLSDSEKKNLAHEMISIQALCEKLPDGCGYGILNGYSDKIIENTWYEFISKRLKLYREHIIKNAVFDPMMATQVLVIAQEMQECFSTVRPKPFLWDASERNVLVHKGKITGIVDVDELCFGDPLLVVALTSTCLELEGRDTKYTDYWSEGLHLNKSERKRLDFYRLFYAIAFMRKHSMQTVNSKQVLFDTERLLCIFQDSFARLANY